MATNTQHGAAPGKWPARNTSDKNIKFLNEVSSDKNTHTPRARRRKMERALKKLGNDERTSD